MLLPGLCVTVPLSSLGATALSHLLQQLEAARDLRNLSGCIPGEHWVEDVTKLFSSCFCVQGSEK